MNAYPPLAEVVTDEAGVAVVGVGHEQGTHSSTVRARMEVPQISLADIEAARHAGHGIVKHTPVTSSAAVSDRVGGRVVLKTENLQRAGASRCAGR